MLALVPRAFVLPLVIVAFEAHETEIRTIEKPFDRCKGMVIMVVVELVAVSVRSQRIRSRGVDNDDFVVVKTRYHGNPSEFFGVTKHRNRVPLPARDLPRLFVDDERIVVDRSIVYEHEPLDLLDEVRVP